MKFGQLGFELGKIGSEKTKIWPDGPDALVFSGVRVFMRVTNVLRDVVGSCGMQFGQLNLSCSEFCWLIGFEFCLMTK